MVASSDGQSAIFTGGSITQQVWLHSGLTGAAHVGRINVASRIWDWQKIFAEKTEQYLTTVTALAIDPADAKLACYGSSHPYGASV